jgi:cytochrome c peroxidase
MLVLLALFACGGSTPAPEPAAPVASEADAKLRQMLQPLPEVAPPADAAASAKIDLGRFLYYENRLSKNQDVSCNSCHLLDKYGVDGTPTSKGHKGALGGRNAPTVYNAALHTAQFWDGRAADVEAQAKGPVLNPIEMAMLSEDAVVNVLKSIPDYAPKFSAAFPGEADPITYNNMANAIGAFERTLVTPSAYDRWLKGEDAALTAEQRAGLQTFVDTGCTSCHSGPALGGQMYMKLGVVQPYETKDEGRFMVTQNEADRKVFKVPSLRNITETAPYLHDGSIATLPEMVGVMAKVQLGKELPPEQVQSIVAFLGALKADLPAERIAKPELPASGPNTPKADPS